MLEIIILSFQTNIGSYSAYNALPLNATNVDYKLTNDIDCSNEKLNQISFTGTFDGQNKTIQNCYIDEWFSMTYNSDNVQVMGLFQWTKDVTIKNLIIKNVKYCLGKSQSDIWNGAITVPSFVGQISGYSENSIYNYIKINVNQETTTNDLTDSYAFVNSTFQVFTQNSSTVSSNTPYSLFWCVVDNKSQFASNKQFNLYTGILAGLQTGNYKREYIYSYLTLDFTFYDANLNGEYCRYSSAQNQEQSSVMWGANFGTYTQ